jgi:hypothetical protein
MHDKQSQQLTSAWKEQIRDYWGIQHFESVNISKSIYLWVTRCSKTKKANGGFPSQLYLSSLNQHFYKFVQARKLRYGILSDKYGLHLDREWLPSYDIHPSTLADEEKKILGRLIREKALNNGFTQIIFYNNSPLMSVPYFQMLYYSGLSTFYTTNLQ